MINHELWNKKLKLKCFLAHMQIAFPNIKIMCDHVKLGTTFDVTFEQAKKFAIEEETSQKDRENVYKRESSAKAIFKKNSNTNKNFTDGRKKLRLCYHCHKSEHLAENCWQKKNPLPLPENPRPAYHY